MAWLDFSIFAEADYTLQVALPGAGLISPVGYFLVTDYTQANVLVQRNSQANPLNVRVYATGVGADWSLDADILETDTVTWVAAQYYYEFRVVDLGKFTTVKTGYFYLTQTYIRP